MKRVHPIKMCHASEGTLTSIYIYVVMPAKAGIQASEVKQTSLFTSISLTNRSRTLLTSFVLTRLDASLRWHDVPLIMRSYIVNFISIDKNKIECHFFCRKLI